MVRASEKQALANDQHGDDETWTDVAVAVELASETHTEGSLVLLGGWGAAVLVRLDHEIRGAHQGGRFVEVGFGALVDAAGMISALPIGSHSTWPRS